MYLYHVNNLTHLPTYFDNICSKVIHELNFREFGAKI